MSRPLAAILATVLATTLATAVLAGCGDSGKPETPRQAAGTDPMHNASTGTQFFTAIASNDPSKVAAAYDLAAPGSRALTYAKLVHDGLTSTGTADTLTEAQGTYKLCRADQPSACHTYAAVTLSEGKVNDFTVDGKRIAIR
ncbi:MAG: hypothetical protein ACJ72L_06230 [Marmoricola sp.]